MITTKVSYYLTPNPAVKFIADPLNVRVWFAYSSRFDITSSVQSKCNFRLIWLNAKVETIFREGLSRYEIFIVSSRPRLLLFKLYLTYYTSLWTCELLCDTQLIFWSTFLCWRFFTGLYMKWYISNIPQDKSHLCAFRPYPKQ